MYDIYFVTNMRIRQTSGVQMSVQSFRPSVLGRKAEINIKLIRNAMFVTAVIVTISLMGKASAHESASYLTTSADHAAWVVAER